MFYSIKIVSLQVFLFLRLARLKSTRRPALLWANLSRIKLDHTNKTMAWFHSQSINHQNRVGVFPYSHWLFCNFPVKFDDQKFSDMCYDEGHCERSILKNADPSHGFLCSMPEKSSGQIWGQSVKFLYLINFFKESALLQKRSRFFLRLKFCKHFTPLLCHLIVNTVVPRANSNPGIETWDYFVVVNVSWGTCSVHGQSSIIICCKICLLDHSPLFYGVYIHFTRFFLRVLLC